MTIPTGDLAKMAGLTARILNMIGMFDAILPHDRRQAAVFLNEAVMAGRELATLTGRLQPPVTLAALEGVSEAIGEPKPSPEPPEEPERA